MESEYDRLKKKVENFPSPSSYTRLAELARQMGQLAEAEAVCRRCTKEFPRGAQAFVLLAEMQQTAGHPAEALALVGQALEREPKNMPGLRLKAELLAAKGDPDAAVVILTQALAIRPNDPAITARLGELKRSSPPSAKLAPVASAGAAPASSPAPPASPSINAPPSGSSVRPPGTSSGSSRSTSGVRPSLQPFNPAGPSGTNATGVRPSPPPPRPANGIDGLAAEAGVRGAVVIDQGGRIVAAKGFTAGQDEIVAAYASEVTKGATQANDAAGQGGATTWSLSGATVHIHAFVGRTCTVAVLAEPSVRAALLEMKAHQILIDLGAA